MPKRRTRTTKRRPRLLHPPMPSHLPHPHTVLASVVANAFEELGATVALRVGDEWYPIHNAPQISDFELEYGVQARRFAYNRRCFEQLFRHGQAVVGHHAGFSDLFVPVGDGRAAWGALASGPFATSRSTSGEISERWYELTGTQGRLSDPSFYRYVSTTLGMLTLEGGLFEAFQRLVACYARLLSAEGDAKSVAAEAAELRAHLGQARIVERTWEAARSMVDERTSRMWLSTDRTNELARFGLAGPPEHVVVGLMLAHGDEGDAVDEMIRRDALQRACVGLARKVGGVVAGRMGDFGVSLLVENAESSARTRSLLASLGERITLLARRFGFKLHVGICKAKGAASIAARSHAALSAAERALSLGLAKVEAEPAEHVGTKAIGDLRKQLGQAVSEPVGVLSPRFDRYLEAVALHCRYRVEPVRAHLEAGIERIVDTLSSTLDSKSIDAIYAAMDRTAAEASTVRELFVAYRGLLSDIELALRSPTEARQERSTSRAVSYIREHLSERLSLAKVAHLAGVSPNYFSKLFKRQERVSFEVYTRRLRLERAKSLLTGTSLNVERIAELCGFGTSTYFHRVFKRSVHMTPIDFRKRDAERLGSARDRHWPNVADSRGDMKNS